MRRRAIVQIPLLPLCFSNALLSTPAQAQTPSTTYPQRPLRILVGYSPGGAVDTIARALAQPLQAALASR